jgi:hypothetical protein
MAKGAGKSAEKIVAIAGQENAQCDDYNRVEYRCT